MRLSNPIYARTWMKIFSPIGSLWTYLGKQWQWQTLSGQKNQDELLLPMNSMSNGHAIHENDDRLSMMSSRHPLRTFFSSFLSPIRPTNPSIVSTYGHYSNSPKTSRQNRFYSRKAIEDKSIYHQIPYQMINDENNNTTETNLNPKSSTIIDLSSLKDSDSIDIPVDSSSSLTRRHWIWLLFFTIIYFTWFIGIAGISLVHVAIYFLIFISYVASDRTRRLISALLIYLVYLLLYDALHLIPNYSVSKVHISDVYYTEKRFFGIVSDGKLMTLNEYFRLNHRPFFDVFTGLCYLNWIPIPLAYSLYLYRYKSKRDYMDFALTFLLTNLLGFIIYYIIPAAPPWYIELYGFTMNINAPGYPAGFLHFDQITGIKLFSSMYSKNANVFAAIPSLHAAYPLITVLYGSLSKKLWLHICFVLFTLSVWFSAVYSRHHYVLDVLAGGTCAVTAYFLYRLLSRVPTINRLLNAYSKVI